MAKQETKSTNWTKSKTTLTPEERSDRGIKSTTQEHTHKDTGAVGSTHRMAKFAENIKSGIRSNMEGQNPKKIDMKINDHMSRLFGNFWNMGSTEYNKFIEKQGFNVFNPEMEEAASEFQAKYGQNPYAAQGSFIENSPNIMELKKYEEQMSTASAGRGMKGEAFGFSGGYGKGKVRAGVSSDMDSKNEEALGNSGLLG